MSDDQLLTGSLLGDIALGVIMVGAGILYFRRPLIVYSRSFRRFSSQHADSGLLRVWRWFLVKAIGPIIAIGGVIRIVNALSVAYAS